MTARADLKAMTPAAVVTRARQAHLAGDLPAAAALYDAAMAQAPHDATLLHLRGALAWQQGDAGRAAHWVDAALTACPSLAAAHNTRGVMQRGQARHADARVSFARALELQPGTPSFAANLAAACIDDGAAEAGLAVLRELVAAHPDSADAQRALGDALMHAGRAREAISPLHRAAALAPAVAEHRFVLGHALQLAGELAASVAQYEAVLRAAPCHARALQNLGRAHADLGDPARSFGCLERAVALAPGNAENHANLAVALRRRGDLTGALARYGEAIARDPANPRTRYHHALTLLLAGDFAHGWAEHEWRARVPGFPIRRDLLARPAWAGDALAGRTLLLHAEQGLGDTIQFARYAATLAHAGLARDGRVVVMVQPELMGVMRGLSGASEVVSAALPAPAHDVQAPLLSLPRLMGTGEGRIPAALPYLQASTMRRRRWAAELAPMGPRVGLVWAGNPTHGNDRERSLPPATARGLAVRLLRAQPGATLYGLQLGARGGDLDGIDARYRSLAPGIADFQDTAAILAELDLLVSVDTSTAHLAGALARPTALLLPFAPDWRWRTQGAATPWYPSFQLCRATAEGTMDTAIDDACAALARLP